LQLTAAEYNVGVKVLILNNHFQGMDKQWQDLFYDERYSATKMFNPDFAKLAEAFRVPAARATNVEELEEAITLARKTKGPFFIHAVVPKEENVFPMVAPQTSLSDTIYYPPE
jgi:acetolactate synthase-1/2/3 large subunit